MLSRISRVSKSLRGACVLRRHAVNSMSTKSTVQFGGDIAVVTAALNGVLTDPRQFDIPVTPQQMAQAAKEVWSSIKAQWAADAGAAVVHIHFRDQRSGKGHLPSWEPELAADIATAIRTAVPGLIVNFTTGTFEKGGGAHAGRYGRNYEYGGPCDGPLDCMTAGRPEMAALNSGSLNYLKTKKNGEWAWPPMLFENPVEKVEKMTRGMEERKVAPECECFDTGIVRSIQMYMDSGVLKQPPLVSLVMGVASGMPADKRWLSLLKEYVPDDCPWQCIAIGRTDIWDLHRETVRLGGNVRTGMEDTFYLPDGSKARNSGELIAALVKILEEEVRRELEWSGDTPVKTVDVKERPNTQNRDAALRPPLKLVIFCACTGVDQKPSDQYETSLYRWCPYHFYL